MAKLLVQMSVTLDGVVQAPGRADEDVRGGFRDGGWAMPYFDHVMMQDAQKGGAGGGPALLFGRRTYEDFHKVWPARKDSPFSAMLDNAEKYVASRTLKAPLAWKNSMLLEGDAAAAVAKLKQTSEKDLLVMGSAELLQSLMKAGLVDEFRLLIHPLTLGSGIKLFREGGPELKLNLAEVKPNTKGVVIAIYRAG
jgi:dihydrofolate reductase